MLAGAVDALERLLMLQAHQAVMACQQAHLLHGQEVLVDSAVAVGVERGQLMLRRGDLVVLGLCRHAQLPQLAVELLHELVDRGTDGAEVMLLELLALQRGVAEQRAARHDEVGALCVILLADQEVLLLGADGGDHAVDMLAEQRQHALSLLVDGAHGAQQRGFLVKRLAGVAAEGGGDAQHLVLDERVAGGVPRRVAAGLEGCAQAAGREAGGVGLALDKLLAGEAHDGAAVAGGIEEAVVLLGGDAGKGLEPMRIVRGSLFNGPFLHGMGDDVGDLKVQRLALLDGLHQVFVRCRWQSLLHRVLVEHHRAVDLRNFRHRRELLHSYLSDARFPCHCKL